MEKVIYKNIDILISSRDKKNLDDMLKDPAHNALNISLETIIETDEEGRITFFMPTDKTKWGLIFYIQNLMIRQRLHQIDIFMSEQKVKANE